MIQEERNTILRKLKFFPLYLITSNIRNKRLKHILAIRDCLNFLCKTLDMCMVLEVLLQKRDDAVNVKVVTEKIVENV